MTPAHLAIDIPPGANTVERYCSDCGKRTVWYQVFIPGDPAFPGSQGWWQPFTCSGPLTAAERADGR